MKIKKRSIIALCVLTGALSMLATGCSGGGGSNTEGVDAKHSYTMWLPYGEESSNYSSYSDNPVIDYLETKDWKDENGKDTKISFDIQVPAAGAAVDNLNTIISTGDYMDVMDTTLYPGSTKDLYEQGIILDLTPYMEEYMPNYMNFLDAHPDYKKLATTLVDGEAKYLNIFSYTKQISEQWSGFMYRRDWIVKYGKSPSDGSAFSGEYITKNADGTDDLDSWQDNVVFPSGGSDPIYISDWEWMFGIFHTALKEEGITDGYCMSISYPGYIGTGDMVSSFGGGSPVWYLNKEDKVEFGMNSDDFRAYLQCMNNWYKNGWIDTAFAERASDMFYQIDDATVRQGKVGAWTGLPSQLAGKSDTGDNYTKGMVVYGARRPINDIYGSEAQKNVEPYCFTQSSLGGNMFVITDRAEKKDMVALFQILDYLYSEEGMLLRTFGLNQEQYATTQNEFYSKNSLTDGDYTISTEKNEDGLYEIEYVEALKNDPMLQGPASGQRIPGLNGVPEGYVKVDHSESEAYRHSLNEWSVQTNTGTVLWNYVGALSTADDSEMRKIGTNINEFGEKSAPAFILGTKDPYNDKDWEDFKKALSKYNPDKATQIWQSAIDAVNSGNK